MINKIQKSEFFPEIKVGDTLKITFKNLEAKNLKEEFMIGQVIKLHRNQNNTFINLYSSVLGVFYNYIFLLDTKIISNIEIIKKQYYHKSKLYFLKSIKNK